MKSTRGLPAMRLSQLPKERRVALGSLALLVTLLGSIILYQRFALPETPQSLPGPTAPGVDGEAPPARGLEVDAGTAGQPGAPVTASPRPSQLVSPLAGKPQVLQPYDYMYSATFGDYRLHPGTDYAVAAGESVLAAGAGSVTLIENDLVEGRVLEIDHGNGLITRYGGLGEVKVALNAVVEAGTEIGQIGAGEQSHLHFEVVVDGAPVNPGLYLKP